MQLVECMVVQWSHAALLEMLSESLGEGIIVIHERSGQQKILAAQPRLGETGQGTIISTYHILTLCV